MVYFRRKEKRRRKNKIMCFNYSLNVPEGCHIIHKSGWSCNNKRNNAIISIILKLSSKIIYI